MLGINNGTINALGRRISLLTGCNMTTLFVLVLELNCILVLRKARGPLLLVVVLISCEPGVTVTIW